MSPELLAPAGGKACLNAAVRAGANAVYLGLEDFNARRGADNFTIDSLPQVCDYCHLRGVKVYVTINTLIVTRELTRLVSMVNDAVCAGVDAFIIQDIGVAKQIADCYGPEFVHISTQMNIHNVDGVDACAALGAGRITLARELSLGEIKAICEHAHELGIEVECFAHGAICVCYSGQCLMSSMIGARSANRGMCAQACRLPYDLVAGDDKKVTSAGLKTHLLSPKDMCTIDNLADFIDAGVDSLKIEGRMKSPEYVYSVVKVYRDVLDGQRQATEDEKQALSSSFSRGFTNGYLFGERGANLMSVNRPNNRGLAAGRVKSIRGGSQLELNTEIELVPGDTIAIWTKHGTTILDVPEEAEISRSKCKFKANKDCKDVSPKDRIFRVRSARDAFVEDEHEPRVALAAKLTLKIGEPFKIEVSACGKSVCVLGDAIEQARTKAVTKEDVIEHFDRLGSTSFGLEKIDVDLDENVGIGFSSIHKLRAKAVDELVNAIVSEDDKKPSHPVALKVQPSKLQLSKQKEELEPSIDVITPNAALARVARRAGCGVYVPLYNFKRGFATGEGVVLDEATQASYPNESKIMLPLAAHDATGDSREAKLTLDFEAGKHDLYCDDLASFMVARAEGKVAELGQFLPVTNDYAIDLVNRLAPSIVWLSPELNEAQIKDIAGKIDSEVGIFAFGPQRLMTCEHCALMNEGPCPENCPDCRRRRQKHWLKDRQDVDFEVMSDCFGRSTIYNSVSLDLSPNAKNLAEAGVTHFMIDATFMDEKELSSIISRFRQAFISAPTKRVVNTTSGHLFRGV